MEHKPVTRDYRMLLASLCLLGLIYPLPEWLGYSGLVCWTSVFWIVMYLSVLSLREGRTAKRVDIVLWLLVIAIGAGALIYGAGDTPDTRLRWALGLSADTVSLVLLLHVTYSILRDVLAKGRVDANRIWGAVCVYILIGLIWSYVFGLLFSVYDDCLMVSDRFPQQAAGLQDELRGHPTRLYFSFVTLTTVGYGDIAPGNVVTRLLATVEAVVGQLYLAILVARLVGLHITQARPAAGEPAAGERDV
jgi:Ion channel